MFLWICVIGYRLNEENFGHHSSISQTVLINTIQITSISISAGMFLIFQWSYFQYYSANANFILNIYSSTVKWSTTHHRVYQIEVRCCYVYIKLWSSSYPISFSLRTFVSGLMNFMLRLYVQLLCRLLYTDTARICTC